MSDPNFGKLTSLHFYAWKAGLKTGMYYLRTRAAADAIKFTVDQQSLQKRKSDRLARTNSLADAAKENLAVVAPGGGAAVVKPGVVVASAAAAGAKKTAADIDDEMERERQMAAMVCSIENKDACMMCSG